MALVLRNFPFASNGFTVVHLKEGDEHEFGAFTQSLVDAGAIEADGFKPAMKTVAPDAKTIVDTKKK